MTSGKKLQYSILTAVLTLLVSQPLVAQVVTGKIAGVITDSSGAVVPGAEVALKGLSTGMERHVVTSDQGQYVFTNLQAGDYRLQISKSGFSTAVVERVSVQVLQTVNGDVALQVGSSSQETTVSAEAPLINSQTSDLGRVVTPGEIQNLPLNGRNYLQLATLTPGVNTFYSNQTGPVRGTTFFQGPGFLAGTQNVGSSITIGDNREIATSYRIDGVDISNPFVGQSALLPALDMVDEFKVITGVAAAPLRSPGSVNVMTRGGTNAFHGSAYEFFRNDALDARSYFDTTVKPKLRMNQFGGAVGGPIVHDKLFFFGGYEGFRGRTPSIVRATVPTAAQLAGDFSASATPVNDPSTGTQFPGNQIPAGRISQYAQVLNEFMPTPNFVGTGPLAALNFETQLTPSFDSDQANGRVDYILSDRDSMFGRYTWTKTNNVSPGIMPLSGLTYPYDSQNAVVAETHSFSPKIINQFLFGYTRSVLGIEQEGANGRNLIEEMGLSNIAGGEDPSQYGLPSTVIIGYGTFGPGISFSPRGGTLNLYELQDNLSYSLGRHSLQFGLDISNNRYSTVNPTAPRGFIAYFGNFSGNAVADYLLGLPLLAIADAGNSRQALRWTNFEGYVQDDWRATDRLTLNLGVRYLYFTAPADQSNGQSYFDFNCPCIVTAASGQIGNGIFRTPTKNFAPRIGLAYDLFGNAKTVLRAGYGIFYFPPVMAENLFLRNNPPNYTLHSITNSTGQPVTSFFPPPLGTPGPNITTFTVDPDAPTSNYQQWTLNVERELTSTMKLTVGYFGSKGTHLQRRINMNQAVPGTAPIDQRRPLPQFGDILLQTNSAISNYSALQATVLKNFSSGFSFWASYEWANGFDNATNEGEAPADRRHLEAEYGRSLYLVPQRFRLTGAYELPFGRGKHFLNEHGALDKIVGGWQVNAIYTAQHGSPLTVTAPATHNTGGFVPSRANETCEGNLDSGDRTLVHFFDTSCYTAPPANTIGNARRGTIWSAGLNNWDLTVAKVTPFAEGKNVRFEAQFFNAFNHPQWNAPITDVSSPSFGRITTSLKGRSIQLGLRLNF